MSLLIKGMEMPTNCFLCKLSCMSGERLFCSAMKNEEVLRSKIDSNCPLIEVPPHGRLIDADALMKEIQETCKRLYGTDDISTASPTLSAFKLYIGEAPTIIEGEE